MNCLFILWSIKSFEARCIHSLPNSTHLCSMRRESVITENHSELHCNIKKTPLQSKCSFGIGRLGFFCNSHTKIIAKISNINIRRHCYSNYLYWKWGSKRAKEKIAYETKMNCLRLASLGRQVSLFYLFFFSVAIHLLVYVMHMKEYALFYFNKNQNSCVFPSKSKCDHFLRSPLYALLQNRMLQNGW